MGNSLFLDFFCFSCGLSVSLLRAGIAGLMMDNIGLELIKLGMVGLCDVIFSSSLLLVLLILSLSFCFTSYMSSSEDQSENGTGV